MNFEEAYGYIDASYQISQYSLGGTIRIFAQDNFGLIITSTDGGKNWQPYYSNDVFSIDSITTSGPNVIVSGGSFGNEGLVVGVFHSNNGGDSFTLSNLRQRVWVYYFTETSTTNAIAASYVNNGFYYSSDNGITWTQSNITSGSIKYGAIAFNNNSGIMVISDLGIYSSSDYGATWTISNTPPGNFDHISMHPNNYSAFMVSKTTTTGVYYTIDFGLNWTVSTSLPTTVRTISSTSIVSNHLNPSNHYALLSTYDNDGIYYTTDAGQTWIHSNITSGFFSLAVNLQGNAVAGALYPNGIYYSSDFGMTWTQGNLTSNTYDTMGYNSIDNIFIAGNSGNLVQLQYSENNGVVFQKAFEPVDLFPSAFDAKDEIVICMSNQDGIYYSNDYGASFYRSNIFNTYSLSPKIIMINNDNVVLALFNNTFYLSYDSGQTFSESTLPGNVSINDFAVDSSTRGVATVTQSGHGPLFSRNGGIAWQLSSGIFQNVQYNIIKLQGTISVVGSRNSNTTLLYSVDSGETYMVSNLSIQVTDITVYLNTVILSTTVGLYYSVDNGATFLQSNLTTGSFHTVDLYDSYDGIAGSADGNGLYYTRNQGVTWYQSNKTNDNFSTLHTAPNGNLTGLAGSSNNAGLYFSYDKGTTWTLNLDIPSNQSIRTFNISTTNARYVASSSRLYYSNVNPCFNENTELLMYDKENEYEFFEQISNIQIGDYVCIYDSNKKTNSITTFNLTDTDKITEQYSFRRVKYIKSTSLRNSLKPKNVLSAMWKMKDCDFIVTGGHSVLVDQLLPEEETYQKETFNFCCRLENKEMLLACASSQFERLMDTKIYKIYHLVLEEIIDNNLHNDLYDMYRQYAVYARINSKFGNTSSKVNECIMTETISEYYLKQCTSCWFL